MNADYCFASQGPDQTQEAARRLGAAIRDHGLVIRLDGPLGAGKTVFVKGLASGLGIEPSGVSSPTFTLVNEYPTRIAAAGVNRLAHADLYRVESEAALEEVGFFDLMVSSTVLAVEWGNRFLAVFPRDHLELEIERAAPGSEADSAQLETRTIRAKAGGPRAKRILEQWRKALEAGEIGEMEESDKR